MMRLMKKRITTSLLSKLNGNDDDRSDDADLLLHYSRSLLVYDTEPGTGQTTPVAQPPGRVSKVD